MKIDILCMCYNSAKFIKVVIESWRRIGDVHIFIDTKTNDKTEEIVRNCGVKPEFFEFKDFGSSRNYVLSKFVNNYRIFIDDSFIFIGEPNLFKRELIGHRDFAISLRIIKDSEWYTKSIITKFPVEYKGLVHEYINSPTTYQIENGYVRELSCNEHLERSIRRFPNDFEIMTSEYYKNVSNFRVIYYICRGLLLLKNNGLFIDIRMIKCWLIRLKTIKSPYKNWASINYNLSLNDV